MGQITLQTTRMSAAGASDQDLPHELHWLCELDELYDLVVTQGLDGDLSEDASLACRPDWPDAWRPLIQRLAARVGARTVTLGAPAAPHRGRGCEHGLSIHPPPHLPHGPVVQARSHAAGGFTVEQTREIQAFCAHLHAALTLTVSLDVARARLKSLHRVVDAMSVGIAVLDEHLEVVMLNRPARELLARTEKLILDGRHLRLRLPSQQAAFERALQALVAERCDAHPHLPVDGLHIQLKRLAAAGEPQLHVEVPRAGLAVPRSSVLLLIRERCEPERARAITAPPALLARQMQLRFALTDKELALAWNLVGGMSLKHYAALAARSIETVRSQLKSVFRKLGVNEQKDIGIVLSETLHAVNLQPMSVQLAAVMPDRSAASPMTSTVQMPWR